MIAFFGIGTPGIGEAILIGVVAVVLFGKRLPEVARSLGSSYQQFRKGLSDIQNSIKEDIDLDLESGPSTRLPDYSDVQDYDEPTAPKFEPPVEEVS
ncbi:MAG: twin-arginine translocase TatA/TatE family subunit [Mariniblastus sp.]